MPKGFTPTPEQPSFSKKGTKCNGCLVWGFTLIEFMIYIVIVAALLIIAVNFNWEIIYGNVKSRSLREVQQNGRFALEKVVRSLRAGEEPTDFFVSDGILYQKGIALTSDRVKVTNFTINAIANTYKIKLSVKYNNPSGRREYEDSMDLESAVALLPIQQPVQGCWGIDGICDLFCRYSDYGFPMDYYIDPDCSESCKVADSFYVKPVENCNDNGIGFCHRMEDFSTQFIGCSQGESCGGLCSGTCTPCRNLNQTQCSQQQGCYWFTRRCRGTCTSCSSFSETTSCQNQLGCSWQDTRWYWNLTDPQEGYSSYINCEWYAQ